MCIYIYMLYLPTIHHIWTTALILQRSGNMARHCSVHWLQPKTHRFRHDRWVPHWRCWDNKDVLDKLHYVISYMYWRKNWIKTNMLPYFLDATFTFQFHQNVQDLLCRIHDQLQIDLQQTGCITWEISSRCGNHTESYAGHWLGTIAQKQLHRFFTSNIRGCQQRRFTWTVLKNAKMFGSKGPRFHGNRWKSIVVSSVGIVAGEDACQCLSEKEIHCVPKILPIQNAPKRPTVLWELAPNLSQRNTWCVAYFLDDARSFIGITSTMNGIYWRNGIWLRSTQLVLQLLLTQTQ